MLPFRTDALDLVALVTTLEFIHDPIQALTEAARVARHGLVVLGVLNRHSLLAWQLCRSGEPPWQAARFFTPDELVHLIQQATGEDVDIVWRTTLWPLWPRDLSLPWGGFTGLAVRLSMAKKTPVRC